MTSRQKTGRPPPNTKDPSIEIVPFEAAHRREVTGLLAARHRLQRRAEPLLPDRFERPDAFEAVLEDLEGGPYSNGAVALRDGHVTGFMLGRRYLDEHFGRFVRVPLAGHVVEDGHPHLYGRLYAALAGGWIDAGAFDHGVVVPASDLVAQEAWFSLGFGREQVHALLDLTPFEATAPPAALEIRRAGPADLETLVPLIELISLHAAEPPAMVPSFPEFRAALREGYAEVLEDPDWTLWLAIAEERVVGLQLYAPCIGLHDPLVPEDSVELKTAATLPAARGRGVGVALTAHGLTAASHDGFRRVVTDWRITNLLAARFWPARGFRPVAYRLSRRLDPRITWARPPDPTQEG